MTLFQNTLKIGLVKIKIVPKTDSKYQLKYFPWDKKSLTHIHTYQLIQIFFDSWQVSERADSNQATEDEVKQPVTEEGNEPTHLILKEKNNHNITSHV